MQTFTGLEYLMIDIASNFGLDKSDWSDRINWTKTHDADLETLVSQAEEPALYMAGVDAYRTASRGKPIGYPISLDAASSGLQILACLAGCEDSAQLCGVVPTGHREDAYTVLYGAMCAKINDTTKISRADTKRAIMTSLYSSQAVPQEVFGTGELLDAFYETMEERAPGAWNLNSGLMALWQAYALSHDWILPDNFHAHIKVEDHVTEFVHFRNTPVAVTLTVNQGTKEGRSLGANLVHSIDGMMVREIHRRCDHDPEVIGRVTNLIHIGRGRTDLVTDDDRLVHRLWELYQASGFLSTRILDHLRFENTGHVDLNKIQALLDTLPKSPFKVISIHDCFRVHPNYGNDLRQQYNHVLSEIAGSDLLAFLASQVTGRSVTFQKAGDISKRILSTDYALS